MEDQMSVKSQEISHMEELKVRAVQGILVQLVQDLLNGKVKKIVWYWFEIRNGSVEPNRNLRSRHKYFFNFISFTITMYMIEAPL